MRFLGNIEARLDAKGRVFLPATFRKVLQLGGEEILVMRKDVHQRCLVLYPESVWNLRMDQLLRRISPWDMRQQEVLREYVASALEMTLDGNGRFLIPKAYLEMGGISQAVRFIGMNDTIEIWPAEKTTGSFLPQEEFASRLQAIMTGNENENENAQDC
jgi:MraZ protein